ncbi:hypothetical protein F4604DRAFT_1684735 [Suillus subluteus]|nr:hypothetical protein F4604DRAFT_1684735 [Suillus subluteus]
MFARLLAVAFCVAFAVSNCNVIRKIFGFVPIDANVIGDVGLNYSPITVVGTWNWHQLQLCRQQEASVLQNNTWLLANKCQSLEGGADLTSAAKPLYSGLIVPSRARGVNEANASPKVVTDDRDSPIGKFLLLPVSG